MKPDSLAILASSFNLATHNGFLTIQSPTGQHRTVRIRTQSASANFAPGQRIVGLLTGPDNEHDYQDFGFVGVLPCGQAVVRLWQRCRTEFFEKLSLILMYPDHYAGLGVKYLFEGRCRVCNHTLTTPESLARGIGAKCAARDS